MLEVLRAGFFTNIFFTNAVDNGESERHNIYGTRGRVKKTLSVNINDLREILTHMTSPNFSPENC